MLRRYNEAREEEGFTLIELLVVIIIIGILAAIAIPAFLGQRERARRAAVQSDLRNMAVAQETYFTDNGEYSDNLAGLTDFALSSGVTVVVFENTVPESDFCVGVTIAGLPDVDGGGWYFDSDASPQLHAAADGGCN